MTFSLGFILWLTSTFLIFSTLAFCFIRLPHKIVRLQAKFYKGFYKDTLKLNNQEIDNIYQLPTDRFLMGTRSNFITDASNIPEKYTRLIRIYRMIGYVFVAMLFLVFSLLLLVIL